MKTKFLLTACLVALGMSLQAKNYDYKTVDGDLTKTRIVSLYQQGEATHSDIYCRSYRFEERPCRNDRSCSLSGAPDVQGNQAVWHQQP